MKKSFKLSFLESEEAFERTLEQLDNESQHMFDGLDQESDRGVALISGAYFETLLGRCLSVYFVDAPSTNELLTALAGLGSFSARVSCCYALRMISDEQFKALELIRKVRNEFAHNFMATFESEKVRSYTWTLCDLTFEDMDASYFRDRGARDAFTWSCLSQALELKWRPVDMAIHAKNLDDIVPFYVNKESRGSA